MRSTKSPTIVSGEPTKSKREAILTNSDRSPVVSAAVYDPIEPTIDERLILRHVFARAYAEPKARKRATPDAERRASFPRRHGSPVRLRDRGASANIWCF